MLSLNDNKGKQIAVSHDTGILRRSLQDLGIDTSWWENIANRVHIKTGKEPSVAYLLLPYSEVVNLPTDLKAITISISSTFLNLTDTVTYKGFTLVKAEAVNPSLSSQELNSMYLVELQDIRHIFPGTYINKAYNVVKGVKHHPSLKEKPPEDGKTEVQVEFYEDTTQSGGQPWTWFEMLKDIWRHLPKDAGNMPNPLELPTFRDDDDGEPNPPQMNITTASPRNYRFFSTKDAWEAFCTVLDDLRHTITLKDDGNLLIIPIAESDPNNFSIAETYGPPLESYLVQGMVRVPRIYICSFPRSDYNYEESPQDTYQSTGYWDFEIDVEQSRIAEDIQVSNSKSPTFIDAVGSIHLPQTAIFTTGHKSQPANINELIGQAKKALKRHLEALLIPSFSYFHYARTVPFIPDHVFKEIVYDHSYSINTKLIPFTSSPEDILPNPLETPLYKRANLIILTSSGIEPNKVGTATLRNYIVVAEEDPDDPTKKEDVIQIQNSKTVEVANLTSKTIDTGANAVADWEYSLGMWVILPTTVATSSSEILRVQYLQSFGRNTTEVGVIVVDRHGEPIAEQPEEGEEIEPTLIFAFNVNKFEARKGWFGYIERVRNNVGGSTVWVITQSQVPAHHALVELNANDVEAGGRFKQVVAPLEWEVDPLEADDQVTLKDPEEYLGKRIDYNGVFYARLESLFPGGPPQDLQLPGESEPQPEEVDPASYVLIAPGDWLNVQITTSTGSASAGLSQVPVNVVDPRNLGPLQVQAEIFSEVAVPPGVSLLVGRESPSKLTYYATWADTSQYLRQVDGYSLGIKQGLFHEGNTIFWENILKEGASLVELKGSDIPLQTDQDYEFWVLDKLGERVAIQSKVTSTGNFSGLKGEGGIPRSSSTPGSIGLMQEVVFLDGSTRKHLIDLQTIPYLIRVEATKDSDDVWTGAILQEYPSPNHSMPIRGNTVELHPTDLVGDFKEGQEYLCVLDSTQPKPQGGIYFAISTVGKAEFKLGISSEENKSVAFWDNENDDFSYGSLSVWEPDESGKIDRDSDTIQLKHLIDNANVLEAGHSVIYSGDLVLWYACTKMKGWEDK